MQYAMVMISTMITKTQSKWTPEQDQKKKKKLCFLAYLLQHLLPYIKIANVKNFKR